MAKSYAARPVVRERVRHVAHLVAFAEPDDVGEVVLDDAEVIAVVVDVRRQQQRVAPADDALLAEVGRAPIDFQRELVGLHDLRRLGESLADLREEGEVAVRDGLVVHEAGVGELLRAARGGPLDEGARARRRSTSARSPRAARARQHRTPATRRDAPRESKHDWRISPAMRARASASTRTRATRAFAACTMSFDDFATRARAVGSCRCGATACSTPTRRCRRSPSCGEGPFAFLLESAPAGGETWSRYTFLGTEPRARVAAARRRRRGLDAASAAGTARGGRRIRSPISTR